MEGRAAADGATAGQAAADEAAAHRAAAVAAVDRAAAEERPRLLGLAYRMLGTMSDAEDVVQDAVLRARRAAPADLASPAAYLTTVTTRTAIDHLRSARVRREAYVGPWLPEPVLDDPARAGAAPDGADATVLAESLSTAFLVLLEALAPEERAALLLHDVFGYPHADVARALDRSEGASRQLLRRARQHLARDERRFDVDLERRDLLVRRFRAACERGDLDAFLAVLTEDATLVSDGGAEVKAARRPVVGGVRVARFLSKVLGRGPLPFERRIVVLNGTPALALLAGGRLETVVHLEPGAGDRVAELRLVRNPAKLARIRAAVEAAPADPRA